MALAAILGTLIVVTGFIGKPGSTGQAPSPVATTPADAVDSVAPSGVTQSDLSFTLPGGTLVIDVTHSAQIGGAGASVSTLAGELTGNSHYAIVGRCYGPEVVTWEIRSIDGGVMESGEVPCDGKTHGTGIVTFDGTQLPMRLTYNIASDFRFVVSLVQG
jgi:hypothetical protein